MKISESRTDARMTLRVFGHRSVQSAEHDFFCCLSRRVRPTVLNAVGGLVDEVSAGFILVLRWVFGVRQLGLRFG
jgi:hypothetical protein